MLPVQLEEIKKLPLFEGLDQEKHGELLDKIQIKNFIIGEFIFREGEALIDPDTGIELGRDTTKIAEISVTEAKVKFSKAKVVGVPSEPITTGDVVEE